MNFLCNKKTTDKYSFSYIIHAAEQLIDLHPLTIPATSRL